MTGLYKSPEAESSQSFGSILQQAPVGSVSSVRKVLFTMQKGDCQKSRLLLVLHAGCLEDGFRCPSSEQPGTDAEQVSTIPNVRLPSPTLVDQGGDLELRAPQRLHPKQKAPHYHSGLRKGQKEFCQR